jgi:DNA mismatch endonuclease Vsr
MDRVTPKRRSANMRSIRSQNTKPELIVRSILRSLDYKGYRIHRKDLPGKPDIAFIGRKKIIFVHGCFWHGHDECSEGQRRPKSNREYWLPKIAKNKIRDAQHISLFEEMGWDVMTIWACEIKQYDALVEKLASFMRYKS